MNTSSLSSLNLLIKGHIVLFMIFSGWLAISIGF
ncbi:hypothetical protein ID866_10311 [Astraeus odoratus]|nr:hypothetical protein ID866_10311 [Astraeus odoratus]